MTRAPSVSPPLHRCCRLATALSAAVLLSACSILPSQTPMDTYVLPAPVTQQTPASAGANTGLALRITRPLVDGAIAGRRSIHSRSASLLAFPVNSPTLGLPGKAAKVRARASTWSRSNIRCWTTRSVGSASTSLPVQRLRGATSKAMPTTPARSPGHCSNPLSH